jgi:DNA-directed RNA polymerase specialized sigma24 family protein
MGLIIEDDHSVTLWLQSLRAGDQEAAAHLWNRYGAALANLARRRFPASISAVADDQDLAQSVFMILWSGAAKGRWDDVFDRQELWWLLLAITRRKAHARLTYDNAQKRAGTVHFSALATEDSSGLFDVAEDSGQLPPDVLLAVKDQQECLLAMLPDSVLETIAEGKLMGSSNAELAKQLGVSERTVIRKLKLIGEIWSRELGA